MKIFETQVSYNQIGSVQVDALDTPEKAAEYLNNALSNSDNFSPDQECFVVISCDRKNKPIAFKIVTVGTATAALVHPREVFREAIRNNASAIIVAHNHPSGDPGPSSADIQVTRMLREASKVIDIHLLDHIILGDCNDDPRGIGHYSFSEAGLI